MSDFGKQVTALATMFAALAMLMVSFHLATGARMDRMEARLMARIDGLDEKVDQNTAVIAENGKAIARLEVRMTRVEDDVTWLRNNYRGDR